MFLSALEVGEGWRRSEQVREDQRRFGERMLEKEEGLRKCEKVWKSERRLEKVRESQRRLGGERVGGEG